MVSNHPKNAGFASEAKPAFFFQFPAIKNSVIFFAFFALLTNCNLSCDPKDCWQTYEFSIPFTITPALDTFLVGDTLWLESLIHKNLNDDATGDAVPVNSFDFKIRSIIARNDTLVQGNAYYANNDFIYINSKGTLEIVTLSSVSHIKVHYSIVDDNQMLQTGIIPQKKGLYQIVFYNLTDDLKKVNLTDSDCFQNLSISYEMNENLDDNNYYLLQNSLAPIDSPEGFKHDGGYAFVVR